MIYYTSYHTSVIWHQVTLHIKSTVRQENIFCDPFTVFMYEGCDGTRCSSGTCPSEVIVCNAHSISLV